MSPSLLFTAALLLGIRHSLEPDHVVAVTALSAEARRFRPAARLGLFWGAGHMVPLAIVGLPAMMLRLTLPARLEGMLDLGVGLLLIGLGISTLTRLRRDRLRFHAHPLDPAAHAHVHADAGSGSSAAHGHYHPAEIRRGRSSFAVGILHGLAGTGTASALALGAAPSLWAAAVYLVIFGAGTCLGMFLMTLLVAAPAVTAASRFAFAQSALRAGAGLAGIVTGLWIWSRVL